MDTKIPNANNPSLFASLTCETILLPYVFIETASNDKSTNDNSNVLPEDLIQCCLKG